MEGSAGGIACWVLAEAVRETDPVTSPPPIPRPREEQPANAVDPTSRPAVAAILNALPATRSLISPLVTQILDGLTIGILGKDEFKALAICASDPQPDSAVVRVKTGGGPFPVQMSRERPCV